MSLVEIMPDAFAEKTEDKDWQLKFVLGQRGCTLLQVEGYSFVRNRRTGYKTYWICAKKVRECKQRFGQLGRVSNQVVIFSPQPNAKKKQGSVKCKARVVTNIVDGVHRLVLRKTPHNHPVVVKRVSKDFKREY